MSVASFDRILDPVGGAVAGVWRTRPTAGEADVPVYIAPLGHLEEVVDSLRLSMATGSDLFGVDGAGSGFDPERARTAAVAEALERYASLSFADRQFTTASALDLGEDAIDLDLVARCSARELADPLCPVRPASKTERIRWVRGLCLQTFRPVWVPAVMAYLHIPVRTEAELFWMPISTGCAGHFDLFRALATAIYEVIERDSLSLVWLQRMAIPRLVGSSEVREAAPYFEAVQAIGGQVAAFDATTALGVPVVYALIENAADPVLRQVVSCAAGPRAEGLLGKVVREACSTRIGLSSRSGIDRAPADFISVTDGGVYMAHPERAGAFDFLRHGRTKSLDAVASIDFPSPAGELAALLGRLSAHGWNCYAVELSTDEALRCGFRVVRVVIPQAMPLSFVQRARYLGHPRLYEAPAAMGLRVHEEAEINPWPQPFS